ncbi:MAG: hypothetical protein LBR10_06425 [Prevotellaceae bacterium]|jgi:hypothetical protein|nr:hypothetical protein [Prevotellaceae bacterium]
MEKIHLFFKVLIGLLIAVVLLQSCYSSKAIGSISKPDYNTRVTVTNAHYQRKSTVFGKMCLVGVAGAGTYGGYKANFIQATNSETGEKQNLPVVGGLLGLAGGVTMGIIINKIAGDGKITYITDEKKWEKWMRKKSYQRMKLLNMHNMSSFSFIDPAVESRYIVKSIVDVRDFKKTFPNSNRFEDIILQAIEQAPREDLPALLSLYPRTAQSDKIKAKYMELSNTVEQCIESANKYPELYAQAEAQALNLIRDLNSAKTYLAYFTKNMTPEVRSKKEVIIIENLIKSKIPYASILEMFPDNIKSQDLKHNILVQTATLNGFCDFHKKYPDIDINLVGTYIVSMSAVKNFEDLKKLEQCFGQLNENNMHNILKEVKLERHEIHQVLKLFSNLDSKTYASLNAMHEKYIQEDFAEAIASKSTQKIKQFIDNYTGSPDKEDLLAKANDHYEYYSKLAEKEKREEKERRIAEIWAKFRALKQGDILYGLYKGQYEYQYNTDHYDYGYFLVVEVVTPLNLSNEIRLKTRMRVISHYSNDILFFQGDLISECMDWVEASPRVNFPENDKYFRKTFKINYEEEYLESERWRWSLSPYKAIEGCLWKLKFYH